jgi:hypothetical protein
MSDELPVSRFAGRYDSHPRQLYQTWPDLTEMLSRPMIRPDKDGPLWSPTLYRPGSTRGNQNVLSLSCGVLDFDHADLNTLIGLTHGYACLLHSTYSHTAESPRYRAVLPLATPVPADQWTTVWRQLNRLFSDLADPAAKDPARIHYLPATPRERRKLFQVEVFDGPTLHPQDLPPLPPEPPVVVPPIQSKSPDAARRYIESALRREQEKLNSAGEGQRHRQRLCSAMAIAGFLHTGLLTEAEIRDALAINFGPNPRNAMKTIEDGIRYGKAKPRPLQLTMRPQGG